MRSYRRIAVAAVLLLILAGPSGLLAQEEEKQEPEQPAQEEGKEATEPPAESEEKKGEAEAPAESDSGGEVFFEAEMWVAQPTGTEYEPATEFDPQDAFNTQVLAVSHGTEREGRYRAGYALPNNWGAIVVTWLKQEDDSGLSRFNPGQFVYGESAAHPLLAGFNNDGLTDSFTTVTRTRLRDLRLDFYREAFRNPRVSGDWFVGWRRVSHIREMNSTYRAVLPDLPVLLPPLVDCPPNTGCPFLGPTPDTAAISSSFEGRGVSAGLDIDFHLWRDKLSLESGASFAVLRGEIRSDYSSSTHAYFVLFDIDGDGTPERVFTNPPYDFFAEIPESIGEFRLPLGLEEDSRSASSQVLEAYLGLRWRALRWLEAFVGVRDTRYDDVGVDLRPKVTALTIDAFGDQVYNIEDVTEVDRSVTYEGFYGGVAFRWK